MKIYDFLNVEKHIMKINNFFPKIHGPVANIPQFDKHCSILLPFHLQLKWNMFYKDNVWNPHSSADSLLGYNTMLSCKLAWHHNTQYLKLHVITKLYHAKR